MRRAGCAETLALAGVCAAFALAALGLWIPADVGSGLVETFRRQTSIGDALAPTAAAVGMLAAAAALGLSALLRQPADAGLLDAASLKFAARAAAVTAASLLVMVHAGPLAVDAANALGADVGTYRQLRDTPPWKHLGYLAGGTAMVAGLIAVVEQRVTTSALAAALLSAAALAVFYDVPFDDLLLPPNGDQ